jgi:hypothetical protein
MKQIMHIKLLVIITLFLSCQALAEDRPFIQYDFEDTQNLHGKRLRELLPQDIAEFIEQYEMCQHWRGEPAFSKERAAQINHGIKQGCTGIEKTQIELESKYKNEPEIISRYKSIFSEIKNDTNTFETNDPGRKSKILDVYYEAEAQWIIKSVSEQIPQSKIDYKKSVQEKSDANTCVFMNAIYMLQVQQKYLKRVAPNIDRLHPITKEKIMRAEELLTEQLSSYSKIALTSIRTGGPMTSLLCLEDMNNEK